ncbi:hypothetical protein JAAARDRAFT_33158 [Jaapia argillacea MUCL 33604]|uniref:Phytocyanin domain-containing protein n=1 Tax=Jaapia argillacea MUCL 33604 TaxID=933084 RepID=A0A067PXM5_9AGAM|nr:hypothetical protein JAAARDRAFT_33158 [Jaapia argillacea MUCL 33604]
MFSKLLTISSLLSLALPLVRGVQIPVTVGGVGIIQYTPSSVTANVGDVVVFTFQQKNHTVTQSSFQSPCVQAPGGFDSGFVPVAANNTAGPFPTAQFTVQDTNPVWVFCRQTGHCQQGMVFAINPGNQFAAFQAAATGGSTTSAPAATATAPSGVQTVTATVTVSGSVPVTTTYGSFPGSAAPTSVMSTDHRIVVGGTGVIAFTPANITAQVGDTITFEFRQKNHTVTQSSFAEPCISLTKTSTSGQIAFDSGFMPVADNITNFPTFTIQVNDTAPIWAYCRQATHCGQGMVFAANAVESGSNTFEAFQAKAKALNGTSSSTPSKSAATSWREARYPDAGVALVVFGVVVGLWV